MSHIKHKKNFTRSDIPYASRLLMDKYKSIGQQRDDAAATSLKISLVALNDTEGLGYLRLSRYARRVQELHLNERLQELGFQIVEGHVFAAENAETGEIVPMNKMGGNP